MPVRKNAPFRDRQQLRPARGRAGRRTEAERVSRSRRERRPLVVLGIESQFRQWWAGSVVGEHRRFRGPRSTRSRRPGAGMDGPGSDGGCNAGHGSAHAGASRGGGRARVMARPRKAVGGHLWWRCEAAALAEGGHDADEDAETGCGRGGCDGGGRGTASVGRRRTRRRPILTASVSADGTMLVLTGREPGESAPTMRLGTTALTVTESTSTVVSMTLPTNQSDGTYLLSLTRPPSFPQRLVAERPVVLARRQTRQRLVSERGIARPCCHARQDARAERRCSGPPSTAGPPDPAAPLAPARGSMETTPTSTVPRAPVFLAITVRSKHWKDSQQC